MASREIPKELNMNGIDVNIFYGRNVIRKLEARKKAETRRMSWVVQSRKMPSHILGPLDFWMESNKQAIALDRAAKESTDSDVLCTFVYQRENGRRKFVVAQPERYWWHFEYRPPETRCSYEIIPENHPCRLYLDLEYLCHYNKKNDGRSMTNTVIDIFIAYLRAHWSLQCNRSNVLNLDSSTTYKFSRHLIFNVKHVAFKNNYHVGRLVKSVCKDILDYVSSKGRVHSILNNFNGRMLEQLFVRTDKGRKLFIDTAVYTKNRHFRIYKATKWGKQSNLTISDDCEYVPSGVYKDKELGIFLDSLVSYFPTKKGLTLIEYPESNTLDLKCLKNNTRQVDYYKFQDAYSKYPKLDRYIRNLTFPGKIRACKYVEAKNTLVYETLGYRYCENIGRPHKSNNIFWVVDLELKAIYQKCHDEDCFGFKSKPKQLPEEIYFEIDKEGDDLLSSCAIAMSDMM